MIFLTDTMPSACPSCGEDWSKSNHSDFFVVNKTSNLIHNEL